MKIALICLVLAALAACAGPPPPLPTGPWHALNDWGGDWGSWQPTPAELTTLPR